VGHALNDQIAELAVRHPLLRETPGSLDTHVIEGRLTFTISKGAFAGSKGAFEIRLEVPVGYPESAPRVYEVGGQVPDGFHQYPDSRLCLASLIDLDLFLEKGPSLVQFVDEMVVSYFLNFLEWKKTNELPFGERSHGIEGLLEGLSDWLSCEPTNNAVGGLLEFLACRRPLDRLVACPCGSKKSLGDCHNGHIQKLRRQLGKAALASLADKHRMMLLPWLIPELAEPPSVLKWRRIMTQLCREVALEMAGTRESPPSKT
jgi:hypothetical protein